MSVETPETTPTPDRPCRSCGAAMAPAQDWCVECGTAAAGRLTGRGDRTGIRAAATIIATLLLLVGGAVAASYAALNSKAEQAATAPAPPSAAPTVADAAPVVTTPPAAPPPPPTVPGPAPAPEPAPPAPAPDPPAPAPAPTPTPTPTPDPAPEPGRDPGESRPLDLGVDVASVYDPYDSALDSTDPADSYDQNGDTVFTMTTDRVEDMAIGLEFDLETRQEVEKVYFRTNTPGFTVEVYGAKRSLPPDILDNRWKPLATRRAAATGKGSDGLVKLQFDPGRYTHIVLWITKPPPAEAKDGAPGVGGSDSATVGFSEVRILD